MQLGGLYLLWKERLVSLTILRARALTGLYMYAWLAEQSLTCGSLPCVVKKPRMNFLEQSVKKCGFRMVT